jgi:hypothetical protein
VPPVREWNTISSVFIRASFAACSRNAYATPNCSAEYCHPVVVRDPSIATTLSWSAEADHLRLCLLQTAKT